MAAIVAHIDPEAPANVRGPVGDDSPGPAKQATPLGNGTAGELRRVE